ncbi:MAG: hypothetical protein CMD06_03945 [Flavobacteriales bacterium]|nr:hypothetical protein [Flavobacteriales bacterium]
MINYFKYLILFFLVINLNSTYAKNKIQLVFNLIQQELIDENIETQNYIGWWIYGEGQHLFKDEKTLQEWDLEFLNEDMKELEKLYLAVCEMEYFPMEFQITGYLRKTNNSEKTTLIAQSFKILYIQGCGEQ